MGQSFFTSTEVRDYDNYTRAIFGGLGINNETKQRALTDQYEDKSYSDFTENLQEEANPLKKFSNPNRGYVYDFGALRAAMYAYNSSGAHFDNDVAGVMTGRVSGGQLDPDIEAGISYVKGPFWWAYRKISAGYPQEAPWLEAYRDVVTTDANAGRAEIVLGRTKEATPGSRKRPGITRKIESNTSTREIDLPWLIEQAASGPGKAFGEENVLLSNLWGEQEDEGLKNFDDVWTKLNKAKDIITSPGSYVKQPWDGAVLIDQQVVQETILTSRQAALFAITERIAAINPSMITNLDVATVPSIMSSTVGGLSEIYAPAINDRELISGYLPITDLDIASAGTLPLPDISEKELVAPQNVPGAGTLPALPITERTVITDWQRVPVQTINGVAILTQYTVDNWQSIPPMTIQDVAALIAGDAAAIQAITVDSSLQVTASDVTSPGLPGAVAPGENNYVVADPGLAVAPSALVPGLLDTPAVETPLAERQNALTEPVDVPTTEISVNYAQSSEIAAPEEPVAGMPAEPDPLQYGYPEIVNDTEASEVDVTELTGLDSYISEGFDPVDLSSANPTRWTATEEIEAAISAFTTSIGLRYTDDLGKTDRSLSSTRRGLSSHFDRTRAILDANKQAQITEFARQLYVEAAKMNLTAAVQWEEQKLRVALAGIENGMRLLTAKYDAVSRALLANADAGTRVALAGLDATLRTTISGAESLTRAGIAAAEISAKNNIAGAENYTRAALAGAENALRVVLAVADQTTKVSLSNTDAYNRATLSQAENALRAATTSAENRLRYVLALQEDISKHTLANQDVSARVRLNNAELAIRAGQANQEVALRIALADVENAARVLLANQDVNSRVALANAENRLKVALTAYEQEGRRLLANAENQLRVGLANQDASLKVQLANQETDLRRQLANQEAALRASLANNEALVRIKLANQDILLKVRLSDQEMELRRNLANQETDLRYDLANQDVRFKAASISVENDMRANLAEMDGVLRTELANQEADLKVQLSNQEADLRRHLANQEAGIKVNTVNAENLLRQQFANQDVDLKSKLANQDAEIKRKLANQDATLKVTSANVENEIRRQLANQDAGFKVAASNQDADMKIRLANQEAEMKRKLANQDYEFRVDIANIETELKRRLANQEYAFRVASANIENAMRVRLANQDYKFKQQASNQDATLKTELSNKELEFKRQVANQDATLKAEVTNVDTDFKRRIANQDAGLKAQMANMDYAARIALANQASKLQYQLTDLELQYKWSMLDNQRKLEEFGLKANAARMVYDVTLGWMSAYTANTGAYAGVVTNALHEHSLQRGQDRDFWINAENQRWTAMVQRASFIEGLASLKWKSQLQNLSVMQQTLASLGQATGTQTIPSQFDAMMTGISTVATAASSLISLGVALA